MATSVGDIVIEVLGSEPPSAGLVLGLEPPGTGLASGCVWIGPSRTWADDSWRSLMKIPLGEGSRLAANFVRKSVASLSFQGT